MIEKADRAELAAVKGDSRTLYSIVKGVRKRAGFKKVILEDGSVARDVQQEQRWWLKHFASQLGGSAATEAWACGQHNVQAANDEIADVVAILPKWRATAPDGVPNVAFEAAPLVMVTQLMSLGLMCVGVAQGRRGVVPVNPVAGPSLQRGDGVGPGGDPAMHRGVG